MSDLLSIFDSNVFEYPGECRTCSRPVEDPRRYCSYWCHLVENGPEFFTLDSITPWLNTNRAPLKPRRY